MVQFKRRKKDTLPTRDSDGATVVTDGLPVRRWAIVDAEGLVVNVLDASDKWVELYRGEHPNHSIVDGEHCGGQGWGYEGGKFIEPVNPKLAG